MTDDAKKSGSAKSGNLPPKKLRGSMSHDEFRELVKETILESLEDLVATIIEREKEETLLAAQKYVVTNLQAEVTKAQTAREVIRNQLKAQIDRLAKAIQDDPKELGLIGREEYKDEIQQLLDFIGKKPDETVVDELRALISDLEMRINRLLITHSEESLSRKEEIQLEDLINETLSAKMVEHDWLTESVAIQIADCIKSVTVSIYNDQRDILRNLEFRLSSLEEDTQAIFDNLGLGEYVSDPLDPIDFSNVHQRVSAPSKIPTFRVLLRSLYPSQIAGLVLLFICCLTSIGILSLGTTFLFREQLVNSFAKSQALSSKIDEIVRYRLAMRDPMPDSIPKDPGERSMQYPSLSFQRIAVNGKVVAIIATNGDKVIAYHPRGRKLRQIQGLDGAPLGSAEANRKIVDELREHRLIAQK